MDYYSKYLKYKKKYNILLDTLTILQRLIKIHNISKIIQPILFNDNFNINSCIRDANIDSLLLKNINRNDCKIYLKFIKTSYDNLNKFNKLKFKKHKHGKLNHSTKRSTKLFILWNRNRIYFFNRSYIVSCIQNNYFKTLKQYADETIVKY